MRVSSEASVVTNLSDGRQANSHKCGESVVVCPSSSSGLGAQQHGCTNGTTGPSSVNSLPYELEGCTNICQKHDLDDSHIDALHKAHHADPFGILGCHSVDREGEQFIVRAWVKDAKEVRIRGICVSGSSDTFWPSSCKDERCSGGLLLAEGNKPVAMHKRAEWLFHMGFVRRLRKHQILEDATADSTNHTRGCSRSFFYELLVMYEGDDTGKEFIVRDAYSYGTLLRDSDLREFHSGSCWSVDDVMGSHFCVVHDCPGVKFTVWCPNAKSVSVVGDWNAWDGRAHPMRKRSDVWELLVPTVAVPGMKYGYKMHTYQGVDIVKFDPFAQEFEVPPNTSSVISHCDDAFKLPSDRFAWEDDVWMEERRKKGKLDLIRREPMAIYEVHLPSWMRTADNGYVGYRNLAAPLIDHIKKCNFTHVEFMPLSQHPFEGSWGYQVTGQYGVYSRLGSGDDFKFLVNELHKNGIGVFVDVVLGHFCKDDWALSCYDGQPLYEYSDPREGEHYMWGTKVYNYGRTEVRNYLLGAAYHWLRRYHIDGLRVDAVTSMVYRNFMKEDWLPNCHGGDGNLEAISLLQELTWVMRQEFPGTFSMAEESTSWKGVTKQGDGGLGFDAKWDLGWMNDFLSYLCVAPHEKPEWHYKITVRGDYFQDEKWIMPLSHDEVVNGKGSLVDKCGFTHASFEDRVRNLRSLYGIQVGLPGRPLVFMGCEIAQGREWKEWRSIDWEETKDPLREGLTTWLAALLKTYAQFKALHAGDDERWNFQWVDCENPSGCVLAFLRKYEAWQNDIIVVANFSCHQHFKYSFHI